MTRRIALAILLTVWTTLVAGGVIAYLLTRSVLLAELDDSVIAGARSLPELEDRPEYRSLDMQPPDAQIIIIKKDKSLPKINKPFLSEGHPPVVLSRKFLELGSGRRFRHMDLVFGPSPTDPYPVTVLYSMPSDHFDAILNRLGFTFLMFGAVAGVAGAGVAIAVSREALRPLRETADVIGDIDERRMDRRIDAAALPEELRPVAERLNGMLARLELSFAQRKQFLADASHELRTPVAALVTTIEVALRRPREAAEYARTLKVCLSDARLLRQLVQTLMEHARSEAAPETAEAFDAAALLNQCADVAEGLAGAGDIKVARFLPPALEVVSYPNRLRGIVMNLMGNAVEHNRPGGMVELHCDTRGSDLEVSVSDTGPGIAPEHLPHIFQPFYRATRGEQPDAARQHLGLGLFLVDSHVKALGGECRIESQIGVGTTFHIRLPRTVAAEPLAVEATAV